LLTEGEMQKELRQKDEKMRQMNEAIQALEKEL